MMNRLFAVRPRVARPASRGWNTLKTLLQIAAMWSVLLGVVPAAIRRLEAGLGLPGMPGMEWVGAALFGACSVIGLWTANVMVRDGSGTPLPLDTARHLVVSGPYRYVRNPMAIGGFGQGIGIGLWLGSPGVLCYVAVGVAIWQCLARPWEERDLEMRFGDRYRTYRDGVRCWLPRPRPYVEPRETVADDQPGP